MEIRDRGIIKNKIALALYNTFLSSMFMGNNGTCEPKDFKRFVKGHLATEGELTDNPMDIMIFFDLFAPNGVDGANELRFDAYVRNTVMNDANMSTVHGNVLDIILLIINDCMQIENIENNLFGCVLAPNPIVEPNNKNEYCGVTIRYNVHDRN